MEENKTIETKVAEAVLQQGDEIKIGDRTYTAAPPTTATLILVSEAVSRLPRYSPDEKHVLESVLYYAKHSRPLGEIAAILILGARGLKETVREPRTREKRQFFGIIRRKEEYFVERVIDRKAELAKEILETIPPRELHNIIARILNRMQIADFFALSTFLIEINLLRQTKVETES